ncbi:uncharacterized protein LOC115973202 isoform X1 [Quercus lobata]|uniref:uncharacterized protein LOC115973202 isoform X1 n=2 Tax=Quercus lobata TaxID=97700 RepID=UPI001247428E|nr:uncharacterized protein LOC115973202 isoform X1 [Quercus lobata]
MHISFWSVMAKTSTSKRKQSSEAKTAFCRRSKRIKESDTVLKRCRPLMEREVKFSSIGDDSLKLFDREGWGIMYNDFPTPKMRWVKEFYENLNNKNEHSVETIVEGVMIHLTPAIIAETLNLPLLSDSDVSSRESYITRNDDNRDEVMRFFTREQSCQWPKKATTFKASKFVNPIHRLGMNIMNTNLFPTANRGEVTLGRMLFLYDMFNNRRIDLPHHLFHVMCHVKMGERIVCPFPSLVTKLLSHKDFNVPEPKYFKAPKRRRPFSRSSLDYSLSHLHRPAPDLERPASPNPIDPLTENDATTTPQSPPAEPFQSLRAFQDEITRSMHAFFDEIRQDIDRRLCDFEERMTSQPEKCPCCAEKDLGAEDEEEGADRATVDAFRDEMPQHFNSMETGTDDPTTDDAVTASRHNLLDNVGDPPCSCSYEKKLLILDVNGLLLALRPTDMRKTFETAIWRPSVNEFLRFCFEKFDVALWSSRSRENLDKLIEPPKLTHNNLIFDWFIKNLIFNWDQSHCTESGFDTLDCPSKPLFLKDLRKVWEKYEAYNAANTLLLDDSPYKALLNPPNTAVFPETFCGDYNDISLGPGGDLHMYLEKLAMAENVQKYVEQNPFGQRAITELDPNWEFYSRIIKAFS